LSPFHSPSPKRTNTRKTLLPVDNPNSRFIIPQKKRAKRNGSTPAAKVVVSRPLPLPPSLLPITLLILLLIPRVVAADLTNLRSSSLFAVTPRKRQGRCGASTLRRRSGLKG
ncbi:hypothetical protein PENTCL1PPCAC_20680, partial [Pristionchus entomophagus]